MSASGQVDIRVHLDGSLEVLHADRLLAYELLEQRPQAPVADAKIVQTRKAPVKSGPDHPRRKFPAVASAAV